MEEEKISNRKGFSFSRSPPTNLRKNLIGIPPLLDKFFWNRLNNYYKSVNFTQQL